jgi:dUTP pyrophosphatase
MSVLNVKRLREDALLPTYDEKSQYILYSPVDFDVEPNKINPIALGFSTSFPTNYAALVVENNVLNVLGGLIDSDYRGEIHFVGISEKELKIKRGQPIASIIMIEIDHPIMECDEVLSTSDTEEECSMTLEK